MCATKPFIQRYSVPEMSSSEQLNLRYDPDLELCVSETGPAIEDLSIASALTGSMVTLADRDPTSDEATDR
jgi:hypothetical protein